ncbi:glycosyl hydrolase [Hymenobacter jejuensis]|uniref:Glycoside hydrolase n=1 Tax=Hymenobacter jejuensis TaxID=2502781 RepID=A0A5B8A6I0_9BACT|nr:glycosyl hydrolase [Hymenobacter jejuensis]QDA62355.1 glycoside hydrolase [Hymenobacter jejuensis]
MKYSYTALCLLLSTAIQAQTPAEWQAAFQAPPQSAKPRVWWHWMNGNVTKEGITKDLEWMQRVGIGGMQQFEANLGTPRLVKTPVVYGSEVWKDALHHTAAEAKRLGLEWTLSAAGGWSETGGPMVSPAEAMKKVVWSETRVTGGQLFRGKLSAPPAVAGPMQDAALVDPQAGPDAPKPPSFYKDFSVVAYRLPATDVPMRERKPTLTASDGKANLTSLTDGRLSTSTIVKVAPGTNTAWVQLEFAQPFRAEAVTVGAHLLGGFNPVPASGQVMASNDGKNFWPLTTLPGAVHRPAPQLTYSFPATTARFFRVELRPVAKDIYDISAGLNAVLGNTKPPTEYAISEIEVLAGARVNRWEDQAAFGLMYEYQSVPTALTTSAVPLGQVIDLTSRMRPDGSLDWQVPAGRWAILRMGYSLTGITNHPAPPELTGLEVDKFSKAHVTSYLENYLAPYLKAVGDQPGPQYLLLDSWEAGVQNWTDQMLREFNARNGYSATPFLPVLAGRVVGSAEVSDRFLWDWRRTISDLLADNHYTTIAELAHKKGIKLYAEAPGAALGTLGDGLKSKGRVDIPMAEFWTENPGGFRAEHQADVLEAASAAHIYGKPIIATESFTDVSRPYGPPAYLKYMADHYLGLGVNRFVIHTSVHQPLDSLKPGITLAIFGQNYTRQNTWAEQAVAWNAYLARCSYLLQQGQFVGDVAYFIGEDAPTAAPFWQAQRPAVPEGYKFDYVNAEVLATAKVENGRLVLGSGMSYRVLVLPDRLTKTTLPLLQKLQELVAAGLVVSGPKPVASPGLAGYPAVDTQVRTLATELWGGTDGQANLLNTYGLGRVYWGKPLADVLMALQTPEDLAYSKPHLNTTLSWIHRQDQGQHVYFVANQQYQPENLDVRFRVTGLVPELWHPDTGLREPVSYQIADGFTTVPLRLEPYGSVFVVFRQAATASSAAVPYAVPTPVQTLAGNWQVSFPKLFNNTTLWRPAALQSWTASGDSTLRYFSGTATYQHEFKVAKKALGGKLLLDLGEVKEIAEVSLNGQPLGILWKAPFVVDISPAVKAGTNKLEVKVTNLWTNRHAGDARLPVGQRATFATNAIFGNVLPVPPPLPSGLLGPVVILKQERRIQ